MPTVYITAPTDAAADIAKTLVEERLAACVNRVDCESVYRWDGAVHTDTEEILLAKTTDEQYEALRDRVVDIHPYDVPCVERYDDSTLSRRHVANARVSSRRSVRPETRLRGTESLADTAPDRRRPRVGRCRVASRTGRERR